MPGVRNQARKTTGPLRTRPPKFSTRTAQLSEAETQTRGVNHAACKTCADGHQPKLPVKIDPEEPRHVRACVRTRGRVLIEVGTRGCQLPPRPRSQAKGPAVPGIPFPLTGSISLTAP